MSLVESAVHIQGFAGDSLTATIAGLEGVFLGADKVRTAELCAERKLEEPLIRAAYELKQATSQIHVIVHTVGILAALPRLLDSDEVVESLSLGAGNTGRKFDLVTNKQIAEFKFIRWQGGAESIRQNGVFKDFFGLAETETTKRRVLYLLGLTHPKAFLNGDRSLSSVMSRNAKLRATFNTMYADRFLTVGDYFRFRHSRVELIDLLPIVPSLALLPDSTPPDAV